MFLRSIGATLETSDRNVIALVFLRSDVFSIARNYCTSTRGISSL